MPMPPTLPGISATNLVTGVVFTNRLDPASAKPSDAPFRLGPGDRLDIEVLGDGSGPVSTFVGPDGKIYFDLLPGLRVWGLTLQETRQLLEERLREYIRDPKVAPDPARCRKPPGLGHGTGQHPWRLSLGSPP